MELDIQKFGGSGNGWGFVSLVRAIRVVVARAGNAAGRLAYSPGEC